MACAPPEAGPEPSLPELEAQSVELGDLGFVWHRPPLDEVDRQWADPSTARIFLNGCFDLMHAGHFNALRQAKSLFSQKGYRNVVLVAGIHSDEAIAGQKGQPVMTHSERLAVLRATKWVDELVTGLPYAPMTAKMADALRVHFICHGDDLPVCRSGSGMYSDAIEAGRFQLLKRTEGISTTVILERLRLRAEAAADGADCAEARTVGASLGPELEATPATTQRLWQFAAPAPGLAPRPLQDARRPVYICHFFDILGEPEVRLLERARALGDYLLVGLPSDEQARTAGFLPALTLMERALGVLSLRPVDDVLLAAPWCLSGELLAALGVQVVVAPAGERGRHAAALERGLELVELEAEPATSEQLGPRLSARRQELAERNRGLLEKERAYVEAKRYVPEA